MPDINKNTNSRLPETPPREWIFLGTIIRTFVDIGIEGSGSLIALIEITFAEQ
jgi:hypothetical protein